LSAFTFDAFRLRAADIAIDPLFTLVGNNHAMRTGVKDTAKFLAAEKNHVIGDFVSVTPIPGVVSMEGYTSRPSSGLETNQVAKNQFSFNGRADIPLAEMLIFTTGVSDKYEIGCSGNCRGYPDA
jgi:hypothetical protein